MDQTPPEAPVDGDEQPTGPRASRQEVRDLGRLRRSTTDRKVAGVAGGLARHLDVDPVILRVAFVVLVFFGGAGLALYGAGWLLLPEDDGSEPMIGLEERTRTVVLMIVGIVAGASVLAEVTGDSWGLMWFPWQLAVVAVVAVVLLSRRNQRQGRPPAPPAVPAPPASPAAASSYRYDYSYEYPSGATTTTAAPVSSPPLPPTTYAAPLPTPRSPRRRGPVLFWFTLALVALAEGLLGTIDLAGAPVPDSAYPALALGVFGVMLLVGAFFGRAGGLILVGLLTVPALVATTAAGRVDSEPVRITPTTAAAVDDDYHVGLGELVVDLSEVSDLDALDGRTIHLDVTVGRIEVVLPADGLDVEVRGAVHGPGHLMLLGEEREGIDTSASTSLTSGAGAPEVTIDAEANVGEIEVRTR